MNCAPEWMHSASSLHTHTQINFLCCMRSSRIVFTTWCDENHKRNLPKTFPIFHNAESTQHFRIEHNLPYNLMLLSTSPSEFFAMHRYEPMSSCWNLRMVSVIRLSYMECKCSCTLYLADDTIISPAVWVPFERRFPDYGMAWYGSKEKKKKRERGGGKWHKLNMNNFGIHTYHIRKIKKRWKLWCLSTDLPRKKYFLGNFSPNNKLKKKVVVLRFLFYSLASNIVW